jgi:replication-associated recombination protein RarA
MSTQNSPKQALFTEAFRPQTLEQMIMVPRVREEMQKGLCDHILLYGKPGIGKTCLSRIMAKFGTEPLTINASLERGIDVIRDKVISYVTSCDLFNGEDRQKVVILEECDAMTNDAWSSLRATIEQFHSTVRFIANCNYIEKVPEPIQSRFNCISLEPVSVEEENYLVNEYCNRIKLILNACHIQATDENVRGFVLNDFPDLRTLVKKVQQLYTRGVTELTSETLGASFNASGLFNIIISGNNPVENYKTMVSEWSNKPEDGILQISKEFIKYLGVVAPEQLNKLPLLTVEIANYILQLPQAIDKFIVLLALVYKLQMIIHQN